MIFFILNLSQKNILKKSTIKICVIKLFVITLRPENTIVEIFKLYEGFKRIK